MPNALLPLLLLSLLSLTTLVPIIPINAELYYITFNETCDGLTITDSNSIINLYNVTGTIYIWLNQLFDVGSNNCSYYMNVKNDDDALFIYSTVILASLLTCSIVGCGLTCLYALLQHRSKATRKLYRTII